MEKELVLYPNPAFPVKASLFYMKAGASPRGLHFHKELELVRVERGGIFFEIGNECFELKEGQLLIINSFCVHRLFSDGGDATITYMQFDMSDYLDDILPKEQKHLYAFINTEREKSFAVLPLDELPNGLLDTCISTLGKRESYYEIRAKGYFYLLTAFLCEQGFAGNLGSLKNHRALDVLLSACDYVEKHLTEKITLDGLCSALYLNKSNFCKLFRNATGRTFTDYVNFCRVALAKELLVGGNRDISEVAFCCGFSSVQHFNRSFKRYVGYAPRKYKKLYFGSDTLDTSHDKDQIKNDKADHREAEE